MIDNSEQLFFGGPPPIVKGIWDNTRFGLTYVQTKKKFFSKFFENFS